MSDPFDTLKELDQPAPPLHASEVRRRGDRSRRRRTTLQVIGAAVVVVVIASGGLAATRGSAPDPVVVPTTQQPTPATPTLGAQGYGKLLLGMDAAQVRATGLVRLAAAKGEPCRTGRLTDGGSMYLSKKYGVVAISLGKQMVTTEGLGLGSRRKQVLTTYPRGAYNVERYWVVPRSARSELQVGMSHGVATEFLLASKKQDCFG
jgi:hypothetical protein